MFCLGYANIGKQKYVTKPKYNTYTLYMLHEYAY